MRLTELAVRRPIATTMVFVALSLLGAVSYYLLPVQLLPDLVFPELHVILWMPSASPAEVEKKLVIPAEGAVASLEGVKSIESAVYPQFADIAVAFDFGTDMHHAYLKLEQKVGALRRQMPEQSWLQIQRSDTADFASILMQVVVGGPGDLDRLRNLADEHVVPALESVDGVVDVTAFGGKEYAVEVIVDEDRCQAQGLALESVGQAIAAANRRTEYLGEITHEGRRHFVSLTGRFDSIQALRGLSLGPDGRVRLGDVAEVKLGRKDADRISRIDGHQAVMLVLRKDSQANLLRVAKNVYREIERLNGEFDSREVRISIIGDSARTVAEAVRRVQHLALVGMGLSLGVLLIFLKRLPTVCIILVAIPVSLLGTFNFMYFAGLSINLLSLVGFAFAIGLLVDNSVVVIENTFRRAAQGRDGLTAAVEGSREVAMPIAAMTGTTVIAFLPVLFLVNNEFRLIMAEFVYSIGAPLLMSVLVSLTLVPMLAGRAIGRRPAPARRDNRFLEVYTTVLKAVLRRRGLTVVLTVLFFFMTLIICLPLSFMLAGPVQPADRLQYGIQFPRGTTIETAGRLTAKLEALCLDLPDVKMVHATIEAENAQVVVEFVDEEERTVALDIGAMRRRIDEQVESLDGLGRNRVWNAQDGPPSGRNAGRSSADVLAGYGGRERIEVRGEDAALLEKVALQVEQRLTRAFGGYMSPPHTAVQPGGPELEVRGRRAMLARWGLGMSDLANVIWFARPKGDVQVVPFQTREQDIDILVRTAGGKERTLADVERMRLRTPDGRYVELAELAEVRRSEAPRRILRRNQQHELAVAYAFRPDITQSPRRLEAMQEQVDDVIGDMVLPRGYTLEVVHGEEEDTSMRWAMAAAVVCVFLFLAALFEDLGTPLCVMSTFPLAIIGVFWGLVLTATSVGHYMVWVGLIMLVGIVVNDAILTLGQARLLMRRGHTRARAVMEGGRNRLRPVMMTTATTVLAMLPLAIRQGGESEVWPPFAVTVIFGLLASTFFTLVFIPALYLSLSDIVEWVKRAGTWGLAASFATTASLVYFGFMRAGWVESLVWRTVLAPAVFLLLVALIASAVRAVRTVRRPRAFEGQDITVTIRNLTKTYGADTRFMRDWRVKQRREARIRTRGGHLVNKHHVREDLVWKLPLLGLLVYLHLYLEHPFWLFTVSCVTWVAMHDLIGSLGCLVEGDLMVDLFAHPSRWRRLGWRLALRLPAVAWCLYLYTQLRAQWWVALTALAAALLLHGLRDLAVEARVRGTALPRGNGLVARIRRSALRIPVVAGIRPRVHALKTVNLEIGKGMFGLLGPNGAGKTTLMRILCNVYEPTYGCIRFNGLSIHQRRADVQPLIGYLPQHFGLYASFSVWDYLNYFALTNDIFDREERETLVNRVIDDVHLTDRKHDRIASLSGGMKQRVGIAQTLLHMPRIIVVDEPTAGLDPIERMRFRNLLAELGRDRIIVFSTHITEDVMSACHDLAVLDEGRVLFKGPPAELQRMADGKVFEALVSVEEARALDDHACVIWQAVEAGGTRVRYVSTQPDARARAVQPTLEDAYLYLLNRGGRLA